MLAWLAACMDVHAQTLEYVVHVHPAFWGAKRRSGHLRCDVLVVVCVLAMMHLEHPCAAYLQFTHMTLLPSPSQVLDKP